MYRCTLGEFRGCVASDRAMAVLSTMGSTLHISLNRSEHNLQQLQDFNQLSKCIMLNSFYAIFFFQLRKQ